MNKDEHTIEEILARALQDYEAGISLEKITIKYPDFAIEIEEMIGMLSFVSSQTHERPLPPQDGLTKILKSLPVTEASPIRYRGGRVSPILLTTISYIMSSPWKVMVPLVAILVVAGGVFFFQTYRGTPVTTPESVAIANHPTDTTVPTLASSTGTPEPSSSVGAENISDILAVFIGETASESGIVSADTNEKAMITSDTDAINEFNQTYENEL